MSYANDDSLPSPAHTSQDVVENAQYPLNGAVICCTSLPPEERDALCAAGKEMGAVTKLDLTSDVTHLIVGATNTPKYTYTAKERPDIKIVLPSWLEAMKSIWMDGGDVNLAKLEEEHRMPALWRLNICVTGFNDLQERSDIQEAVNANGATYHGDLTKSVTHLIAATPQGKKYEYAGQWGIKIVAIEWLHQSIQRGMILDESLFSPLIPAENRGRGAYRVVRRDDAARAQLKKRKSEDGPSGQTGIDARRKLRRTASTKLESQTSGIWEDLGNEDTTQARGNAEWDEAPTTAGTSDESQLRGCGQDSCQAESRPSARKDGREEPHNSEERRQIFKGYNFLVYDFDERKASILRNHLAPNGGTVEIHLHGEDHIKVKQLPRDNLICIVSHEQNFYNVQSSLEHDYGLANFKEFATEWWVEKCIFSKTFISLDTTPICRPLKTTVIIDLPLLTITPTSFVGIDLLHFSKAVKLIGMTYDETLRRTTDVLVCGLSSNPSREKLKFAFDNGIPFVKVDWFWRSLELGKAQSMDDHLIIGQAKRAKQPEKSGQLFEERSQYTDKDCTSEDAPANSRTPASPRKSSTRASGDRNEASRSKSSSQPLRELTEIESNSQRRKQSSESAKENSARGEHPASAAQNSDPNIAADDPAQLPGLNHENQTPPELPIESIPGQTEPSKSQQHAALSDAITHLRAQKSTSSFELSPRHRRHRPLGRAPSNPSSMNSKHDKLSTQQLRQHAASHDEDDMYNEKTLKDRAPAPSQALCYENEESKAVREKLLKHDVDEGGLRRVEGIGKVKDASPIVKNEGIGRRRAKGR